MRKIFKALTLGAALLAFTSCDNAIYDYDDECREGVELRFVYDYNMEWADAFPSQVECLTVLVYDSNGQLVERREETSDALHSYDYRMTIDLPEGHYHIVAYGGMECDGDDFRFEADPANLKHEERTVSVGSLKEETDRFVSDKLLTDHFHGMIDLDVQEADVNYTTATVEMMKNTNNYRIILKNLNGNPLNHSQFGFRIEDDNVRFAHDNSILPSKKPTHYLSWTSGEVSDGLNADGKEWTNVFGELSTSRLITRQGSRGGGAPSGSSSVESPRLVIDKTDGSGTAVDVPLLNMLLQFKSERYADISAQEFLDRKSSWDMMFFLDDNNDWVYVQIKVDNWTVRINRAKFE